MIIIIPAHNEQDNIGELLSRIKRLYPSSDVLVIDDGSTDQTARVVKDHGVPVIKNPRGSQYGDGFLTGLRYAVANAYHPIIFMDAGLSHQAEDIHCLLVPFHLRSVDVVIGSRVVPDAVYTQRLRRKAATFLATRLFSAAMLSTELLDYSSFRIFSLGAAQVLSRDKRIDRLNRKAHAFNPQILAVMRTNGFRIEQSPIRYVGTTSTLNPRGFAEAVLGLLAVLRITLRGVVKR